MTRRGRKRRLVLEDEYWKLILDGVRTVEACRQIGVGRKTGYRWHAEAGGLPPARVAEETRSSRYLSLLERQRIATLRERGHGVREIAQKAGDVGESQAFLNAFIGIIDIEGHSLDLMTHASDQPPGA